MSIELEASLIEKAVEERNTLLEQAEKRAKRILENAEEEKVRLEADVERHLKTVVGSELRAVHDRIVGRANLEGRKLVMGTKMEIIDSIFKEAQKTLENMVEKGGVEYETIMEKLVKEAVVTIGEDELLVSSNNKDQALLNNLLTKLSKELDVSLELDREPIVVIGGVEVRNLKGTKIYYNTLGGRLAKIRDIRVSEVAEKLGVN
jgi:vacuolar-type H+-ATPase subunit E/Vma4